MRAMRARVSSNSAIHALLGASVGILSLATPEVARAFCIYNDTGTSVNDWVSQGNFSVTTGANSSSCCNWANTSCNPSGNQEEMLTAQIETSNFNCVLAMPAGGWAQIDQEDRSSLGLPPNYYCTSYDVNGALVDTTAYNPGLDPSTRNVRFLATADPQFWQDPSAATWNATSTATLGTMMNLVGTAWPIQGALVAGDLTQYARPYTELAMYESAIRGMSRFVYDGIGNHDGQPADEGETLACGFEAPACVSPDLIQQFVTSRKRQTVPTSSSPYGHYSWDWHDVHFVQLNLFPGNSVDSAQYEQRDDPRQSLLFLQTDLAKNVGSSRRPVVLVHHFGFDPFSTGQDSNAQVWWTQAQREAYWDVIAKYHVVGIFAGHSHEEPASFPWRYGFNRPADRTTGPASIPSFVSGATGYGAFVDATMNDNNLVVIRKDQNGNETEREYVDLIGNLALKQTATQSSLAYGGDPARAVDGSTDGNFNDGSVTHTDWERQPWWQVDLGSSQAVGRVMLYNRTDCCSDRLTDFSVQVSTDAANWTSFHFLGTVAAQTYFDVNMTARYVRVILDDDGYTRPLSLAEVQVLSARASIVAEHSGQALDTQGSVAQGTGIVQEPYSGADSQRFTVRSSGQAPFVNLVTSDGMCLDVQGASTADGAPVIKWPCNGQPNQQFNLVHMSNGYTAITALHSSKCLDITGVSQNPGTPMIQWDCDNGPNQAFTFRTDP